MRYPLWRVRRDGISVASWRDRTSTRIEGSPLMGKLILWLMGLLIAIVTMNLTVYLALTALFGTLAGARRLWKRFDRVRELVSDDRDRLPDA